MGQAFSCASRNEAVQSLLRQVVAGDCRAALECIQENPAFLSAPYFPGKNTLLHMVARYGQTSMLSEILQLRDQVASSRPNAHIAAGERSTGILSCCSDDSAPAYPKSVLINAVNTKQQTSLIIAATRGHADIVQILINEGALIQVADKAKGCTALHYAAMHGHVECVKILLCAAGLQARGSHMATNVLHPDRVRVASDQMENDAGRLHTRQDASRRHHDFINCVDSDGATALHLASRAGAAEVVKLLCEYGADVNAVFLQGTTSLHIAAEQGHRAVTLAILKHIYEHNDVQDPRDMLDGAGQKPHQLAVLSQHYRLAVILQPNRPLHRLFDCPNADNAEIKLSKLAAIAAQALKQQLCTVLDQLEAQVSSAITVDGQTQLTEESCMPCAEFDAAKPSCHLRANGHSNSMSEITRVYDNPLGMDAHHDVGQSGLLQPVQFLQLSQLDNGAASTRKVAQFISGDIDPAHEFDGAAEITTRAGPHSDMLPQHAADTAVCPVCYEDIDMSHMLSCQPCQHQLCVPCARHVCTAIKTKPAACPMCRANIHGFMLMVNPCATATCNTSQAQVVDRQITQ